MRFIDIDVSPADTVLLRYSSKAAQKAIGTLVELISTGGSRIVPELSMGSNSWMLQHDVKYMLIPEGTRLTDTAKPRMAMKLSFEINGILTMPTFPQTELEPTLMLDKASAQIWRGDEIRIDRY